jgi:peptide/nickel transport system ATP-binding protein
MTALLRIDGLRAEITAGGFFGRVRLPVLAGVSLSLAAGESLALVGESGSGKTTLARCVMGLTPVAAGDIRFDGVSALTAPGLARLRGAAALMFQDAAGSLSPRARVGTLLTEPFRIHGRPLPDPMREAARLLGLVGLAPAMADRFPHELSGGQARRVALARALALGPRLIIADEPTAGLDMSVQAEILNLMGALRRQRGLAYLVITHNLALVRHAADRVAVLYLGRVVEEGPTREVFAHPLHPYTAGLIAAEPRPDPRRRRRDLAIRGEVPSILRRPSGCEFHPRCPRVQDLCRRIPPSLATYAGRTASCHLLLNRAEHTAQNTQGDRHAVDH